MVVEGKTGFLVPVGEIEEMTQKALLLLTNEDLHSSFGRDARKLAQEQFDIHTIIPRYESFYEEVLDR